MTGVVTGLYICADPTSFVSMRRPEVTVVANGFAGDKHATWERAADSRAKQYARGTPIWNSRQLSIVSEEDLAAIAGTLELPSLLPEWFGANLCVRGIPALTELAPGTRLIVDTAGLYVTALNKPCVTTGKEIAARYPDVADLAARFVKAARNLRGVVAVVERPGTIHEGATITVRAPSEI
jgi:MOSC domain-containing protein YiiM